VTAYFPQPASERVKLAFHDTDTDILADILARIVGRMSACRSACHRNNFRKSRVSDVSARILARMSASVSASWNASFRQHKHAHCWPSAARMAIIVITRGLGWLVGWLVGCYEHVCLAVCPLSYPRNHSFELRQSMSTVSVTRSSSGDIPTHYQLPVLRMTSYTLH